MKKLIIVIVTLLTYSNCSHKSVSEKIAECAHEKANNEGISYEEAYDDCEEGYIQSKARH